MASLAAPAFGPVIAVITTCPVIPVLRIKHTSTSVSFSGISTSGFSTPTTGSVKKIIVVLNSEAHCMPTGIINRREMC